LYHVSFTPKKINQKNDEYQTASSFYCGSKSIVVAAFESNTSKNLFRHLCGGLGDIHPPTNVYEMYDS
jgi:hypothetical protein